MSITNTKPIPFVYLYKWKREKLHHAPPETSIATNNKEGNYNRNWREKKREKNKIRNKKRSCSMINIFAFLFIFYFIRFSVGVAVDIDALLIFVNIFQLMIAFNWRIFNSIKTYFFPHFFPSLFYFILLFVWNSIFSLPYSVNNIHAILICYLLMPTQNIFSSIFYFILLLFPRHYFLLFLLFFCSSSFVNKPIYLLCSRQKYQLLTFDIFQQRKVIWINFLCMKLNQYQ